MGKILLLLLAFAVAYWIIKAYKRRTGQSRGTASESTGSEDMVRCAQCGVHLPRSESLMSGQLFYCSADHRRTHEKTG